MPTRQAHARRFRPPDRSSLNLAASGAIAVVGGVAAAATDRVAPFRYAFRLRWLRSAVSIPTRVVADFGIRTRELVYALATGEPRTGTFRAKPFPAGGADDALGAGWRAFVGAAAGFSPNAYVVEIDPKGRQVLVHDLVPNERSEAPAVNAYLIAAAALALSLVPPLLVCVRGRPIEGAVALQLSATTVTLIVLCLSAGFHATTYYVVAVIAAALAPVNGLVTARMLGHDL